MLSIQANKIGQRGVAGWTELDLPAAGLQQYLTRNLGYELGEREIKGLERFRDIASEHGLCRKHDVPFVGARVQVG